MLSESALVCKAIECYLGEGTTSGSAYELAGESGLIGYVLGGPSDLSANRKHFEGFATADECDCLRSGALNPGVDQPRT